MNSYKRCFSFSSVIFFKLFFLCAFLFPVYTSSVMSPYYPEIIPSALLLFLSCALLLFAVPKSGENRIPALMILLFLIGYNSFFLYYMTFRGQWAYENINVTICFLSFLILLMCRPGELFQKHHIVPFLIAVILLTTVIGIIVYHLGYTSVSLMNGNIVFTPHDPDYYETRFSWLYFHKSQYCFMLLLFLSFFVSYKKYFPKKVLYYAGLIILLYGIYISHTFTALFASLFIFAGDIADLILPRITSIKKRYFLAVIPFLAVILYFVYRMSLQRNIFSLGGRLSIWKESINQILQYSEGVGDLFGGTSFSVPGLTFEVYNCHNYFLNIIYRFSLPAGICFGLIFLTIIVFSLIRRRSFLTAGIWIALLLSLGMDYALLTNDLPAAVFLFYMLFFCDRNRTSVRPD